MCRFAAKYATDRNQRVVLAGEGTLFCGERQFECARNVDDVYIAALCPRTLERVHCRGEQPVCDEAIETTDGDRKTQSVRCELAVDFSRLEFVGQNRSGSVSLLSLKSRRAFFQKSFGTFAHVFCGAGYATKSCLKEKTFLGRHCGGARDRFYGGLSGERRVGDDLLCRCLRSGQECSCFINVVHEPDAKSFFRADEFARETQLMRHAFAAEAGETLRSAIA